MNKSRTIPEAWRKLDSLIVSSNIEIVTQANHGFIFTPITMDSNTNKWIPSSTEYGANAVAVRVDDNKFELWKDGTVAVPPSAVDEDGEQLQAGKYYWQSINTAGNFTKEQPVFGIAQRLLFVRMNDGVKYADVNITAPIQLRAQLVSQDTAHSVGLATTEDINTILNKTNILAERPTITTKAQADELFSTTTNIVSGYTYIEEFEKIFADTGGVRPVVPYGFLYTYVYKQNKSTVYQIYIGFAGDGQYNVSRRGVVQANGIDIVYSNWKVENQQILSGGNAYGNFVKMADGTLIQYGNVTISQGINVDANTLITMPTAFLSSQPYSVTVTISYPASPTNFFINTNTQQAGRFNVRFKQTQGDISTTVFYMAIGKWR